MYLADVAIIYNHRQARELTDLLNTCFLSKEELSVEIRELNSIYFQLLSNYQWLSVYDFVLIHVSCCYFSSVSLSLGPRHHHTCQLKCRAKKGFPDSSINIKMVAL